MEVTPTSGKGTLDTWRFHRQRGVRTQSRVEPYVGEGTRPGANHRSRGVCESALKPCQAGKAQGRKCQGSEPDLGKPAVRDYRGAPRNVAQSWRARVLSQHEKGLFEAAGGGTLFLDEIGETVPAAAGETAARAGRPRDPPMGGIRDMQVDVRVIAASNRDLEKAVREGPVSSGSLLPFGHHCDLHLTVAGPERGHPPSGGLFH
jgi:hypothetical protein